jgi:hypothetical protein
VAEPRLALGALADDELAGALRQLASSIGFPSAVPTEPGAADLAERVRRRVELNPPRPSVWQRVRRGLGLDGARRSTRLGGRPMRRGLVLALVALLVLAAVAGAVGLSLPGLRIIFGEGPSPRPSATATSSANPSASISPLGGSLFLGTAVPFADVERRAGFDLLLPTDPDLGPPDASYLDAQRVALVWASRTGLPETESPGVGLVLSEFRGHVDEGFFQKILDDQTTLTRVTVDGSRGYWISGRPHFFMYVDPHGDVLTDESRVVGDVLVWTTGDVTYRLETSLGMAGAIRLAESLR